MTPKDQSPGKEDVESLLAEFEQSGRANWTHPKRAEFANRMLAALQDNGGESYESTDYDCPDCGKRNYKPLNCMNCGYSPPPTNESEGGEGDNWAFNLIGDIALGIKAGAPLTDIVRAVKAQAHPKAAGAR